MSDLTESQIEKQEDLSDKRLALLKPEILWGTLADRPTHNLIDLMHWVKESFVPKHSSSSEYGCFIHNKIVIDGSFLEFCEQKGVKIKTLYLDSVASWRSEHDSEHFMAQGVFKITYKNLEFIHAALFHKGNQNEDEVSFFIVVNNKTFHEYVKFRNEFDKWLIARDREHLEIHVVGGEGQPYSRNINWNDLFLPQELKDDIRNSIEGWLAAKDVYAKAKIPWKRGILLYGQPGNGKTTTIRTIIANYDFKPVTVHTSQQTNDDTITEAFEYAQEQSPGLLYIEDLDTLLGTTVSYSHFLNLMDGVSTKNGMIVIATANDLSKLKESVTDRPSRFDRKWEIPCPDKAMATKYMKHWFGNTIKADELAKHAVDSNFSYAYFKELYLTSMFHAMADGRKKPNIEDIKKSIKQLLHDKKLAKDFFEHTDHSSTNHIGIE
jgi:hypothetical protein